MKIEVLEDFFHGSDKFQAGEVRVVSDSDGAYFCGNGWVKDADGKVETAERDVNRKTLYVDKAQQKTKAKKAK